MSGDATRRDVIGAKALRWSTSSSQLVASVEVCN